MSKRKAGNAIVSPEARQKSASWLGRVSSGKDRGKSWTSIPPAPSPKRAMEMARKAKWYQRLTEKIRVNRSSKTRRLKETTNNPM